MISTLPIIFTDVKLLQQANTQLPILVTLSGIATDAKLSQPLNASEPISYTPLGMVMFVRFLQLANVLGLIYFRLLVILTVFMLSQPAKTFSLIVVTDFHLKVEGIVMSENFLFLNPDTKKESVTSSYLNSNIFS